MQKMNDSVENWNEPEEGSLAGHLNDEEFERNTVELYNLAMGWVDELMADEDALAAFLRASLLAHLEEEEAAAKQEGSEDTGEDEDIDTPVAQVWISFIGGRFQKPVEEAVNRLVRPIIHGFSSEDLDVLCGRMVQSTLADILMEVDTRVMQMDVTAFLKAYQAKLSN